MNSTLAGQSLRQLDLANKTGVMVAAIVRSGQRINVPGGDAILFPGDKIQIIGSDDNIKAFCETINTSIFPDIVLADDNDLILRSITVGTGSTLCNKTVCQSRLREDYECMLIGFEEDNGQIGLPQAQRIIMPDDRLWVVGEKGAIHRLVQSN